MSAALDRASGKAYVRVLRKGKKEERSFDLQPDALDFASAVTWLRLQPLDAGSRFAVPIFTTRGTFTLAASVVGRERIATPAGA